MHPMCVDGIKSCHSSNLREVEGSSVCVDYQEIKIQDKMDGPHMKLGDIPRTIVICVDRDLVDKVRPGDDIVVVGTIIRQWKPIARSARCSIDLAVHAHSMRDMNYQDNQKVLVPSRVAPLQYCSLITCGRVVLISLLILEIVLGQLCGSVRQVLVKI